MNRSHEVRNYIYLIVKDMTDRMISPKPQLTLYNTLTRQKEIFVPLINTGERKDVWMYTCWPTVYSEPHVGNMKPYVFADLLRNTMVHILGYPVKYVVNITDVGHLVNDEHDSGEDKMEKWSRKEGISARELARKYEAHFKAYLQALNIELFDEMPRATQYIAEQIAIVKDLIAKEYTYIIPWDGIYMDTSRVEDYGKLLWPSAAEHLSGLQAGARIENQGKRNPTDFALRKFSPKEEKRQMERIFDWSRAGMLLAHEGNVIPEGYITVDSTSLDAEEEATRGFPGRHIECSAMSRACLGDHFDIHTWGVDHIPIHHTDEIAQSECSFCNGKKRVNYRLHVQFLNINGKKVAKSAGDDLSLPGLKDRGYDALDLRYFLMTGHYRSFLDFTWEHLHAAQQSRRGVVQKCVTYIRERMSGEYTKESSIKACASRMHSSFYEQLQEAFLDDINTPQALAILHSHIGTMTQEILEDVIWRDTHVLKLGIHEGIIQRLSEMNEGIPADVQILAQERLTAKQNKDFAQADTLRQKILEAGYEVKDTTEGYEISKKQ